MNIRHKIRRQIASAAAAIAVSAFFIGVTIAPVPVAGTASVQAQQNVA